ncbi:hypothetical protein ADUPG1_007196 [Aduncisulcus paluster]|uniref:PH domain-containing protein n=1 Tax=Aduncisulcus paluster TaxID=2918883 RepID=A0ABQ5K9R5_9EUKA|nr:hypothetical protein ADUPG1_000284 [Aduncisulcus paluster]GKT33215.1 hypothetical protein ADUPG1_007196 [Aduncisulcus paluster]
MSSVVVKSGYIIKQGGTIKSWKQRFMILTSCGTIRYFESPSSLAPKNGFDIRDINDVELVESGVGHGPGLILHMDKRAFKIKTFSAEDASKWHKAFVAVKESITSKP